MHDSKHQFSHINRRFAALIGIGASLIIILGIIVFNAHAGTIPGMRQSSTNSVKSALNLTPIHNECHTPPHKIGDETLSIQSGGLSRTFIVHLAPSYGYQPQALVMNYHGYQNTALRTAQRTNMGIEADRAGFILVFPQGVDNPPSWNAGVGAYGPTGYSLGGGMAYRIACALSNQIAAIATVAGAFYRIPGGCNPSRPIPVLEIHGQADQFAPYDGNISVGMTAVQTYLNFWLVHDRCKPASKVIFQKADVTALEWSQCAR